MKTYREPLTITWGVHDGGYRWVNTPITRSEGASTWFLVPASDDKKMNSYKPLENQRGLFITFAELSLDRESIKAFADQHGLLGLSERAARRRYPTQPHPLAEDLKDWEYSILCIKELVALWSTLRRCDFSNLSAAFMWKKGSVRYDLSKLMSSTVPTAHGVYLSSESCTEISLTAGSLDGRGFQQNDLMLPAWHILQQRINHFLNFTGTVISVLPAPGGFGDDLGLFIEAKSLIAALWLQFASAVCSKKELQRCQACNRWFHVGPDGERRAGSSTCSDACRQRLHRMRIDLAREMRSAGKSYKEIAGQLDTGLKIVKRWVKGENR